MSKDWLLEGNKIQRSLAVLGYNALGNLLVGSVILALLGLLLLLAGCSTATVPRYQENQFSSRLEYLRFCQHYAMYTQRCE